MRSKIISHFIIGKISLNPMERILTIPCELEYLKGLMKLTRWKRNEVLQSNQIAAVASTMPNLRTISINRTRTKTIQLLVEMNNHIV
jgi:hypothetical protein